MSRRLLAAATLLLLAGSAGCAGVFGPGEVDEEALSEPASYDWNTTADATLTVQRDAVLAVYRIENRSSVELYRFERFNNERPLDPAAVQFRYPNGTVVGPEAMEFSKTRSRTVVELPADEGQFAVRLPKHGKTVRTPTVVEGSYEVVLPENARVRYFLLGRVVPSADERLVDDAGRVHLLWDAVTRDRVVVEYYLERDLLIFAAVVSVGSVALVGGLAYFWLQLRTLRDRRESVAWEEGPGAP